MATTDNLGDFLTSVANAIRSKSGSTAQINAQDFASEIENLPSGGTELPAYMSAKNFTFDGNACTGYVGDNTLPEIIIPKSYSTVTSTETVAGAKVLDKENLSMSIYDFQSATFSDGGTNTQTYTSTSQLQNLSTDFPNDCYLVSMQGSYPSSFNFLRLASDMQMLQFPIYINGQSFDDGMAAFDYIIENNITDVNFAGDVEVITFIDGNDYQVTSVSGSINGSGFKNYQNRIILLSNLKTVGDYAFQYCSGLTSIEIPSSVKTVGNYAFSDCSSLTSIEIPSSITSIGSYAFQGCSSLASIEIPSSVTSIEEYVFDDCSLLASIEIPSSVTSIGDHAFSSCNSLANIVIPSSVTSIGDYAFSSCNSLASIEIPSSVTSIGSSAFSGCSLLASIEIPSSITSIGDHAFSSCNSLESLTFGENSQLTSIGPSAFSGCSSLASIEIPSSVTSIGWGAFDGCSLLEIVIFEEGSQLKSIESDTFNGCSSLASIEIPSSVKTVGNYAFSDCSSLTSIEIPSSVISIGVSAFTNCSNLTTMTILATTPPILGSTDAISTATKKIYIPAGTLSAYQSATNWSNFASLFEELSQ